MVLLETLAKTSFKVREMFLTIIQRQVNRA